MNNFEQASKTKLRFSTEVGTLTSEDLWDLPIENVDQMAIQCKKQIEEFGSESFITKKTRVNKELELQFEILKSVIETRVSETNENEKKMANKQRINHLLEIRAKKENDKDAELSLEELDAMIAEIKD